MITGGAAPDRPTSSTLTQPSPSPSPPLHSPALRLLFDLQRLRTPSMKLVVFAERRGRRGAGLNLAHDQISPSISRYLATDGLPACLPDQNHSLPSPLLHWLCSGLRKPRLRILGLSLNRLRDKEKGLASFYGPDLHCFLNNAHSAAAARSATPGLQKLTGPLCGSVKPWPARRSL
ncbi:unnamed protein product [Pleuronectes platessa]|uniref:Uncharacterized protein n=1 Tax=Pleuronectes platessa TaxID=8262 RepID=A0A9N7YFG9_PLEPL|nr:unnamed protein product [Pleuronectes platessa]